jgi:hypothetical protein
MLAGCSKKYYIFTTMLNLHISSTLFALSLLAGALLLRRIFALHAAAALRLSNLR